MNVPRVLIASACLFVVSWAHSLDVINNASYPDPERLEEVITAFESEASNERLPRKAIVCTGSSGMRSWHDDLYDDLAPLTIIERGFDGGYMNDLLVYADRIILPYYPRAVVLYAGDDDIAGGLAPETVHETFRTLVVKVHAELPKTRFYVLSIKPSPSRWDQWSSVQEVNELLKQACQEDERLTYVDVASAMLGEDGTPRADLFAEDALHMNRQGYEVWRDVLRSTIIKAEWPHE